MGEIAAEYWKRRKGFILAAIGSAIGLGNIWRFSWLTYRNGGGAFLIPYFIALLIVGVPLLILEFLLGNYFAGSSPKVFRKIRDSLEIIGWIAILDVFIIGTYYAVVLAWVFDYIWLSITYAPQLASGTLSASQLFGNLVTNPWLVLLGLVVTWFVTWYTVFRGVSEGIEKASLVAIPLLWILSIILVIRGVTLPGADTGINWYLSPDFSKLASGSVWIDAFGQILFTLSIMAAPLIVYASYMPKKSELPNSAWITAFANCGFSFFFGFATWGIIGYLMSLKNVTSPAALNIPLGGGGLAFITIPTAMSQLPGGPSVAAVFGLIFFLVLWLAGYTSLISIIEPVYAALRDKFGVTRRQTVTAVTIISFIIGLIFVFDPDMIDPVDFTVGSTNLVWIVLLEAAVAGFYLGVKKLREYANPYAELKLGVWFDYLIKYVAPISMAIILFYGLWYAKAQVVVYSIVQAGKTVAVNAPGTVNGVHPVSLIVMVALLIAAILVTGFKWRTKIEETSIAGV